MDIKLAENIRTFRKKHMLTQEQLAEALGVTVSAVYKWESGRSTPEVSLLIEMADLFEISIDVLLGYKVRNNDKEHIVQNLKDSIHSQPTEEALMYAEKALKKYPNHFEIVYYSARLYCVSGIATRNRQWSARSLELLRHAGLLIDQNTNDEISALSIQVQMAQIYADLDEKEKAIELLKKNNPMRINNAHIGELMALDNKLEDAIPFLSEALIDSLVALIRISSGYINIYMRQEKYHLTTEVLQWILGIIRSFGYPGMSNFLNKTEAIYLAVLAEMQLRAGQKETAADTLRQAKHTALLFDADPSHALDRIRFVKPDKNVSAYDNIGDSAMEGIQNIVLEENYPELTALWEEIANETE